MSFTYPGVCMEVLVTRLASCDIIHQGPLSLLMLAMTVVLPDVVSGAMENPLEVTDFVVHALELS